MPVHDSWRQRQSICSWITPLIHLWGDVLYILILAADIRIEYWSYTRYVQFFYPQPWSLYSFTTANSPSKQFTSLHIKIPYLHDESLRQQKCNVLYVCNLHNGFCWWNACWASITTKPNVEQQEHINIRKSQIIQKAKSKFIGWFFFLFFFSSSLCISSQWIGHMMIHAVHRWGTFTQRMTVDIWSTTTHTKIKQIARFNIIPRFQKYSKDMKSTERHIQLIINVPCVICLPVCRSCLVNSHEEKCVRISLTFRKWFLFVNVKIHLQPEYWDKQFTVTNLHTRVDSYL